MYHVKRWGYFTILATLAYAGIMVSFVIELKNDIELLDTPEGELSIEAVYFIRPEVPPPGAPFDSLSIETYAGIVIIYAVLWYTWGWRDVLPLESKRSSGRSTETTSSGSGDKHARVQLNSTSRAAPAADTVEDIDAVTSVDVPDPAVV